MNYTKSESAVSQVGVIEQEINLISNLLDELSQANNLIMRQINAIDGKDNLPYLEKGKESKPNPPDDCILNRLKILHGRMEDSVSKSNQIQDRLSTLVSF